jgi:aquaporin Z
VASRLHWPEYFIEAAGLGTFMVSAATFATLIHHPALPVREAVPGPLARRMLMGVAMGLTAICLIYSPWGQRSGAHLNPSVTLTFLRLGKVTRRDAAFYIGAQFVGGFVGIALAAQLLSSWIADPSINYVATQPGPGGVMPAFLGELVISFILMTVVLTLSGRPRLAPFTGLAAGLLVTTFITFEDPWSGMSMNPARTLGPSVLSGMATGLWLYFVAPPLGMLCAATLVIRLRGRLAIHCAKMHHGNAPCIFCGEATGSASAADPHATSTPYLASHA